MNGLAFSFYPLSFSILFEYCYFYISRRALKIQNYFGFVISSLLFSIYPWVQIGQGVTWALGGADGPAVPNTAISLSPPQAPNSSLKHLPQTFAFTTHSRGMLIFCELFPFQGAARDILVDLQLWKALETRGRGRRGRCMGISPVTLSGRV